MNDRIRWIREKVKNAGANGVVVGISGGIDSSVVAALAKKSFPNNSLGIFIDIDSSRDSHRNFLRIVHSINIKNINVNLTNSFNKILIDIFEVGNPYKDSKTHNEYIKTGLVKLDKSYLTNPNLNLIKGNLKARLRMATIYAYAQKNNYLVLETSNKSEFEIGYYTKWGDGVGDIAPILDLLKSEVYSLAKELNIPEIVINTPPTADFWNGQEDEKELGFSYKQLEDYINGNLKDKKIMKKIEDIKKHNEHKKIGIIKFNDKDIVCQK